MRVDRGHEKSKAWLGGHLAERAVRAVQALLQVFTHLLAAQTIQLGWRKLLKVTSSSPSRSMT
ncbi:hypothetical protein [Stutzerimonas xanthomarina]|uniref:hypothetical protein n=1 Tax=Stutzerimonas xanthomarina TaxID=271420 RepID=UPI003AA85C46